MDGESHGWRSLVGYSPRGGQESDTTERLHLTLLLLWSKKTIVKWYCKTNPTSRSGVAETAQNQSGKI